MYSSMMTMIHKLLVAPSGEGECVRVTEEPLGTPSIYSSDASREPPFVQVDNDMTIY